MAKVNVQVTGGQIQQKETDTIGALKSQLGLSGKFTATVNGEPVDDQYQLEDYEFVAFAEQVKGA